MIKGSFWMVSVLLILSSLLYGCSQSLTDLTQASNATKGFPVEEAESTNTSPLDFTNIMSGYLSTTNDYNIWPVSNVKPGRFKVDLSGPSNADFDLYVKAGSIPTLSSYDCRGYTSSSNEHCEIAISSTTTVYIMVRSYYGSGGYTIQLSAVSQTGYNSFSIVYNFRLIMIRLITSTVESVINIFAKNL